MAVGYLPTAPQECSDMQLETRHRIVNPAQRKHSLRNYDMGKVMGASSKELAGKADGAVLSKIVKEILSK